jgi:molybdopterin adenylyltransferase
LSTPTPLRIAVLTVSDTRTLETDKSGAYVAAAARGAGHVVSLREIVPDELTLLQSRFSALIADQAVDVIIATGGTGITQRDVTPEALAPLVTKWIPGFGELFRYLSFADIGAATIQSRAEAALCGGTLVFVLPGSTGACQLALEKIIVPQLDIRTKPCNFAELLPRIRGERP